MSLLYLFFTRSRSFLSYTYCTVAENIISSWTPDGNRFWQGLRWPKRSSRRCLILALVQPEDSQPNDEDIVDVELVAHNRIARDYGAGIGGPITNCCTRPPNYGKGMRKRRSNQKPIMLRLTPRTPSEANSLRLAVDKVLQPR